MTRSTTHPKTTHPTRSNLMTLQEVYDELGISKSTWNDWKNKGRTPKFFRLPNNQVRIRRAEFDKWLENLEKVNA